MKKLLVIVLLLGLASAQTDDKQLSIYGCVNFRGRSGFAGDPGQICKIYDPETHRRFMFALIEGEKGDSISLIEIDHETKPR